MGVPLRMVNLKKRKQSITAESSDSIAIRIASLSAVNRFILTNSPPPTAAAVDAHLHCCALLRAAPLIVLVIINTAWCSALQYACCSVCSIDLCILLMLLPVICAPWDWRLHTSSRDESFFVPQAPEWRTGVEGTSRTPTCGPQALG